MWMYVFSFLLALDLTSTTADGVAGCGRQASQYPPNVPSAKTRIIGGTKANPHSWPWQVSIRMDNGSHFCGGSILRVSKDVHQSDMILTAAHCIEKDGATRDFSHWKIVTGTNSKALKSAPDAGEEWRGVVKAVYHENYKDGGRYANDVAVIRLDKPIAFSDFVRPACLPEPSDPVPVGLTCVATGWGRNESDTRTTPDDLQQALSPVYDVDTCQEKWGRNKPAWRTAYICAAPRNGASSTCQGDSGGPLVCRSSDGSWVQHGIVSFGVNDKCKSDEFPPVFTRVPTYVAWIWKKVAEMSTLVNH